MSIGEGKYRWILGIYAALKSKHSRFMQSLFYVAQIEIEP